MVGRRVLVPLLALLFVAVMLSGCVAKKDDARDEVLRSWSRDKPSDRTSDITISVPQDAERLKLAVSTKPPKGSGPGFDWQDYQQPCYSWPCETQSDAEPTGHVSVTLWDPRNVEQGNLKLPYDSSDALALHDPIPGTWLAKITYHSYDGPVSLSATEPAKAAGGGLGGSFWDIVGVILAIMTLVGGAFLYRRRGQSLSREMHRIDHTFRDHAADVVECRQNLLDMKDHLAQLLVRRKLEESQYLILEKRIDQYLRDLETPGNRHGATDRDPSPERQGKTPLDRFRRTGG